MPLEMCIFDVNGVLLDSNSANARAMAQAFTEDPLLQEKIARRYLQLTGIDRGSKIRIIQEEIIGRPFEEGEFERRWESFKTLGRHSMLQAPLGIGSREVLAELGRRNIRRAALSNTPWKELTEILEARGLAPFLDIIRGGGDWPKSESLGRLLDEFQFPSSRCLFLGDGKGDLAAARAANVPFVAIDPGRGEFDREEGLDGPYENLAHWGREYLGIPISGRRIRAPQ